MEEVPEAAARFWSTDINTIPNPPYKAGTVLSNFTHRETKARVV